ncbi:MAG TPA: histidine kinase [Aquabacterium sp.]|nr:histidine kinase [Aquabacterium sp.]
MNQFAAPRMGTYKSALAVTALSAVVWAVAAVILQFLVPELGSLYRVLMFSECVGLTMVACVYALRTVPHFQRYQSITRWLLTGGIAIPTGFVLGHQIAFFLLGEPMRMVGNERISAIPIVFTILIGGVSLLYFATQEQLAREAAARSEAQRLAMESQLRLLRAQLDPHMLFNTLANVRSLLKEDAERAEAMIDQLIVYLRSALVASQTDFVTLSREFAQLRAYLDIMALRMGPRLAYRLDLPDALRDIPVPPMLLQPLVENAIKHGLEPKVGPGSIEIVAATVPSGIEIRVMDSGLGLPVGEERISSDQVSGSSYGLQHVRERLRAVYGQRASLRLDRRDPSGVSAVVSLPG